MKILIVKASSLGDIIHAFPALTYLRNKYPDATIDWVIEKPFEALVKEHPAVNNTLTIDTKTWRRSPLSYQTFSALNSFRKELRKKKYDLVFDLQGNTKSGLITLFANASTKVGFGKSTVAEGLNCLFTSQQYNPPKGNNIRDDYLFLVQRYFNDDAPVCAPSLPLHNRSDPFQFMVCPGSAWKNKQLPFATLKSLLERISATYEGEFLFVWGNAKEKEYCEALHTHFSECSMVADYMPLPLLQNRMKEMGLVIAVDSLPLHLAATVGVATFSVFGPSSAKKYAPQGKEHLFYQGECPYGRHFEKRCPVLRTCPTGACMSTLSPDPLFAQLITAEQELGLQRRSKSM